MENVIKRAFCELNNIFQDEFNKILFQQSTNVRFFLSHNRMKSFKAYSFGHALEFSRRMTSWCKRKYSAIYDVIKSYLTRV